MPQVKTTVASNTSPDTGRIMAIYNKSQSYRKRYQILHEVDRRRTKVTLEFIERNAALYERQTKKVEERYRKSLRFTTAYQMVAKERAFPHSGDFNAANDRDYSMRAMKPDINKKLHRLHPTYIRNKKAREALKQSQHTTEELIEKNSHFLSPRKDEKHTQMASRNHDLHSDESFLFSTRYRELNHPPVVYTNKRPSHTFTSKHDLYRSQRLLLPALRSHGEVM